MRRRSSWMSRYKSRHPRPRFKVGDSVGNFVVSDYVGYTSVRPVGSPDRLSREHHWYGVTCKCGTEEVHTQQHLIDQRRHRMCKQCISKITKES